MIEEGKRNGDRKGKEEDGKETGKLLPDAEAGEDAAQ